MCELDMGCTLFSAAGPSRKHFRTGIYIFPNGSLCIVNRKIMNLDLVAIFVTIACTPLTVSIDPTSSRFKALQGCIKGVGIHRRRRDT